MDVDNETPSPKKFEKIGFITNDEDHVSILSSQIVIDHYNQVLNSFRPAQGWYISDFGIKR